MKSFLFSICAAALIFAPNFSNSQESFGQVLSSYKITRPTDETMQKIAKRFEVVSRLPDGFEIIVPAVQKNELFALDPKATLIRADIAEAPFVKSAPAPGNGFANLQPIDYRTLADVQAEMAAIAQAHPDIAQLVPYGESQQHRPLLALKISDNVTADENEPQIMLTAATHGDEVITTEVLMNLLNRLVENYKKDARLSAMIDNREIFFIPVVNVDGFYYRTRYDNNVDPNRSYPYPKNPNATPTASIRALIDFFNAHNFAGSIDFHAYGELIMYPWAYTYQSIEEEYRAPFHALAGAMAQTNHYTFGPISKVIYVAEGSSADYYFWQKKTKAFAIEVGRAKQPVPTQIQAYTEAQAEPLWRFIESF